MELAGRLAQEALSSKRRHGAGLESLGDPLRPRGRDTERFLDLDVHKPHGSSAAM
jgi:hypothetical protein